MISKSPRRCGRPELGQDSISPRSLDTIQPSPENDKLYRPVDPNAPDILELAASIRKHGLREPLVVTLDGFIVSGHRRYTACRRAGIQVAPVRVEPIRRTDDIDAFVALLREYNRQREKSFDEKLREAIVSVDSQEAHIRLLAHRREQAEVNLEAITISGEKRRARITRAKRPLLDAIKLVRKELKLPVSARKVHYKLVELPEPPLVHASKAGSVYTNDKSSYRALVELLTRARIAGEISFDAISDETRPVTTWAVYSESGAFVSSQISDFLHGYHRDYMQWQPCHIEFLCEKNTAAPVFRPVCGDHCIPMTSGRGFCSLPPRYEMWRRFTESGKERLVVLIASDHDPDGEEIAHSFAGSMRDDFGVEHITAVKVALRHEQVAELNVTPNKLEAKKTSSNYKKFAQNYGNEVYELEALDDETLQQILRDAIDSVIDMGLYNAELAAEAEDVQYIEGVRRAMLDSLEGFGGNMEDRQ